jgi:hypothetical protein
MSRGSCVEPTSILINPFRGAETVNRAAVPNARIKTRTIGRD